MKFVDLDSIDQPVGQAKIKGVTYRVNPMKVKSLINLITISESQADLRPGEYMLKMAETLQEMMPECTLETLLSLSTEQLTTLMNWTRDVGVKEAPESEEKNAQPTP